MKFHHFRSEPMSRLHKNIEFLIRERGDSVKGASKGAGLGETTIRDILADESKSSRINTITKLADYFGVSTEALMGSDLSTDRHLRSQSFDGFDAAGAVPVNLEEETGSLKGYKEIGEPLPGLTIEESVSIQELDVKAQGGAGSLVDQENVVRKWSIPNDYLRIFTRTNRDNLFIIGVVGDSMIPDFPPGQRVLVDVSDKLPSPEGVFVVFDGFGLMIKRCQMVPHSNPPRVRLISTNKEYPINELEMTDELIKGRVIGAWKWH